MSEVSAASSAANSRSAHALRAAGIHLLLSAAVAGGIAALVFGLWFPSPLRELVGGTELFWWIVGVDVACGPLLTVVVFNPAKPRTELVRDLALVAIIQLLALGYGVHTLAHARPVVLVYEVDRFRVVTYSDLAEGEETDAPDWAKPWSLSRPRILGLRPVSTSGEKLASIDASLQGVEPSQRPSWWQDYALSTAQVLQRARPLSELSQRHPHQTERIDKAVALAVADRRPGETAEANALRWMPLVSRRVTDWVALIDPQSARLRGYVHVDGFLE